MYNICQFTPSPVFRHLKRHTLLIMGRMYIKWWSYSWLRLTCLFCLLIHKKHPFCGRQAVFRHFVHEKGAFCGQHVLPNQSFDALYQDLTEYEHDIYLFYLKSTCYKLSLFVDPTPEYGQRTMSFCIVMYASIIRGQYVRSPLLPRRSAQVECLPECGTRVACAHVRRNAEVWRSESLRSGHVRGILAVRHLTKF